MLRLHRTDLSSGPDGHPAGVSIHVESTSAFPLHVAIRTVVGGLPTTTVLGDVTLSSNSSDLSQLIAFPQVIPQVAGEQYAIVVNYAGAPPAGGGQGQGAWGGATGNFYPDGDLAISFDGGVSWLLESPDNFDLHFKTFLHPPLVAVAIDIKPGSSRNPIQTKSHGTIPVAIISSPGFDAPSSVNVSSLTFGRTGDEQSLAFCNSGAEDVNEDELPDLICHFLTQMAGFQPGGTVGVLKGTTVDDTPLLGTDAIVVLK